MELKKNPKKDLNRNSNLYFILGLALVMLLTYVALEWKSYEHVTEYDLSMNIADELLEEVPLFILKTPPPPPPPVAPTIIDIVPDDPEIDETPIAVTEPSPDEPIAIDSVIVDDFDEDITIGFIAVEEKPIYPGCENAADKFACFSEMITKHVRKNQRYPDAAQELDIQGRVSVMFVIQKDGSIGNVRMRGPHKILEAEAARIIEKLPKMTPGKQRGTPVNVPFSIPITFKLQ